MFISGSLVHDYIMNFPDAFRRHILPDQIHILNLSFMVDTLERSWGGTAGNIAYTVKLLGGEPSVVSALGKDGQDYQAHCKAHGISDEHIFVDDKQFTATAYITTDVDNNQIAAFYPGPLKKAADIDARDILKAGDIAIIAATQKEAMMRHVRDAAAAGMRVVFDPGQQMTAFSAAELKDMIERSEFVIGNDYEIKLMEDRTGWGAKEILHACRVLITTLGERGSVVSTRDGALIEIPPCPPQSCDDPTGAGDAYRAGFFVGVQQDFDYAVCGRMGSTAASYAIETPGTQAHAFTKEAFCDRYEKTFGDPLPIL